MDSVLGLNRGSSSVKFDPTRVTQLSWRPRAFIYEEFLSDEECDHLINLAKDKLEKSMLADNESGKSIMSEVRTSSGMFLAKAQDEVVAGIEARIAAWTFLPIEGRLSQIKEDGWSECAKKGYAGKPDKGDALLFFSLHLDATTDHLSLHGICPVIEGEKWSATKWIHVRDFDKPIVRRNDGECVDENVNCSKWAKVGECDKNPLYIVGNEEVKGFCMKS